MPIPNLFEHRYIGLVNRVIETGEDRETRAGPTKMLFGEKLEICRISDEGFPILTTRKMYPRGVWGELAGFIHGCETVAEFVNYGCNYWDANAREWPENFERSPRDMRVGKIYGGQWRSFNGIDQLTMLINGLVNNPDSRRHLLTTYNPAELHLGCLPPCHLLAQFSITNDEGLDCCVYMRSVDLCVGLPSDIILYATLMELLALETETYANKLTFMFGDTHVYKNHLPMWEIQSQREPLSLPVLELDQGNSSILYFDNTGIALGGYKHYEPLTYPFNV